MAVDFIRGKEGKKLSSSAYKILEIIEKKGDVSATELTNELDVSTRTIHYGLKRLVEKGIIDRKPYLFDMRQTRYSLANSLMTKVRAETHMMTRELPFQGQLR